MKETIYLKRPKGMSHSTPAPVIAVKRDVIGYFPIYTKADPASLNHPPISEKVAESALSASMFGWDAPIAKEALAYMSEPRSINDA